MSTYSGVGMPNALYLQRFGQVVLDAFGWMPYQVGSSLGLDGRPTWRDVDVRVILPDDIYDKEYGDPKNPHSNPRWVAMVLAFSALGKQMTGLPIDFQIQQTSLANKEYGGDAHPRSALHDWTRVRP